MTSGRCAQLPNPNFWQRRSPSRGGREPKRQPDLTGDKPCCCRARKLLRFLFLLGKHSFEKLDFFLGSGAMWSCKKTWVVGLEVSYVRKQLMVLRKILVARKLASTSSTLWSPQLSLWRATRCLNGIRWCWMVLVEVVLVEMELLGWSCKVVVRK